jgi:hypothetical protein
MSNPKDVDAGHPLIGIYVSLIGQQWTIKQHPEEVYQTLAENAPHLIISFMEDQ